MAQLKDITLFLLDMDGTVNLGYDPIDGAKEFLETLKAQGKNFIFLTNNSSKNAFDYVEKMRSLDFPCDGENVFTSGMAAGMFLQENKKDSLVYVCGTESLKKELKNYNVNISEDGVGADTVLLGYDTELDYKKIRIVATFSMQVQIIMQQILIWFVLLKAEDIFLIAVALQICLKMQ